MLILLSLAAPAMPEINDNVAVVFGVVVTLFLAATMVVAGLKAGITPGASTLVVLTAWAAFSSQVKGPGGRRFLNLTQVAGSSGMAVVSGVIFTAPLLQVIHLNEAQVAVNVFRNCTRPEPGLNPITCQEDLRKVDWATVGKPLVDQVYKNADGTPKFPDVTLSTSLFMMLFCAAGSLIGYGFVGISTKKFLSDPTLPAPEAHACSTMVTASAASAAEQPAMGPSLVLSSVASFLLPMFTTIGLFPSYLVLYYSKMANADFVIQMPCSPVYIGIGGLLTLPTAIVTVSGAFTRLVGDALVAPLTGEIAETFPSTTMRWVGGGAMTVGVVFSLVKFMMPRASKDGDNGDESLLDIPQKMMVMLYGAVAAGVGVLALGIVIIDREDLVYAVVMILTIFIMASLMVTLGAILSLQIGSSASPVSGTVFVTTLVCCLVSLAYRNYTGAEKSKEASMQAVEGIAYMLITACVAVSAANDASQDYKTLQLGGIPPRDGFFGQIAGLLGGSLMVPISYYIAHNAYGLGTDALPAPQGTLFATIIDGILIEESIPWTPVIIGLSIGIAAVGIEVGASMRGMQLPAMGFAVGLYLPPQLGLGILFGAGFRYYGEKGYEKDTGKQERTYESILAAAGMITGAAFLDLIVGILVILGVDTASMVLFFPPSGGDPPKWFATDKIVFGVLGLQLLGGILYYNARYGIPEASESPALHSQLSTANTLDLTNEKASQARASSPALVEQNVELGSS